MIVLVARSDRRELGLRRGLEESVVLALFDLVNHLNRRGEQLAALAGLTTQQWLVLLQIAADPNFPTATPTTEQRVLASDIARVRGVSRPTISTIIAVLKARGFVVETPDEVDGRRRWLEITPAGIDALAVIEQPRREANLRLLGGLSPADRRRFLAMLEHCLALLTEAREDEQLALRKVRRGTRRPRATRHG